MTVNGLFFFIIGEYPSDSKTIDQISKGRFNIPVSYLSYFFLFMLLSCKGIMEQRKIKPTKKND
jgi:hypothetical protein